MRGLVLLLLALASCDGRHGQDETGVAMRTGEQAGEIEALQARVDKLETQVNGVEAQEKFDAADADSQISSLRNTFNNDVDIDNKRAQGTAELLTQIDDRLAKIDGQHTMRR